MKIVDELMIELEAMYLIPPLFSSDVDTGLKITTTNTIKHWNRTLTLDVFAKSAMSCIEYVVSFRHRVL